MWQRVNWDNRNERKKRFSNLRSGLMLCLTPSLILARNLIQAELMKLAVDRVEESEPPNRTTSYFNKLLASFSVKVSQIMSHRNCGVCVCHSLAKYDCSWPASLLLCQSIKREGYFVIYAGRRNKKSDSRKIRKYKTKTAKILHIIHYKKKLFYFVVVNIFKKNNNIQFWCDFYEVWFRVLGMIGSVERCYASALFYGCEQRVQRCWNRLIYS